MPLGLGLGISKIKSLVSGLRVRFQGNATITAALDGILRDLSADFVNNGTVTAALEAIKLLDVDFSGDGTLTADLAGVDPDYQAVLDYATTQGYTLPSASQQDLQNQLVLDLKSNGSWSNLDSFAVFATDGDNDFALVDWIRLTTLTAVNSPSFTQNEGFQGDGATTLIQTGFILNTGTNFIQGDASFGVWQFDNVAQGNYGPLGTNTTNYRFYPNRFAQLGNMNGAATGGGTNQSNLTGVVSLSENGSNIFIKNNGVATTTNTSSSTSTFSEELLLLKSTSAGFWDGTLSAFFIGNETLSNSMVTPLTDYVNSI